MTATRTAPCAIGLDFGTASVRAVVVETATGAQCGSAVAAYPHGVIDGYLPGSGQPLGVDWALQDPRDYLVATESAVRAAVTSADVDPAAVVGIGVDFTSCTILPVDRSGRPLSAREEYATRPHAWVKLWKHHAAQPQADRINAIAAARNEPFLPHYGGRTSSEWLVAKVLQILDEDPVIYDAADAFVEGGDWMVWQLTGALARNACAAGYKGFWTREHGFPSAAFFAAIDPRLATLAAAKLPGPITPPGRRVGTLTTDMARRLGLSERTAVGAAIIDAHSAVPAAGVVTPGRMVLVMGTSTCHMLLADRHAPVEGIGGIVWDGIVEGYYGYEAGQAAVGDLFAWCVRETGGSPDNAADFAKLEREASAASPGGHGLVALDWWNGNRSVLGNADLTGLLVGLTLSTTAAHIYRSLLEATGYGTRRILDAFEAQAIPVTELIAVGGLAERSPLLLQIYADITGRPIRFATADACALGAAMLGAVAAGEAAGGHRSLVEAAASMTHITARQAEPDGKASQVYSDLYREYLALHDYFGRGGTDVMTRLRRLHRAETADLDRHSHTLSG